MSRLHLKVLSLIIPALLYLFPPIQGYTELMALFLILAIGVPHGAADHVVFSNLNKKPWGTRSLSSFIIQYLLLGISFLIIWALFPLKALVLFLLISIYHFGQEHFYTLSKNYLSQIAFCIWGGFVLIFPLVFHSIETSNYLTQITGVTLGEIDPWQSIFILLTLVGVLLLIIYRLYQSGNITYDVSKEILIDITILTIIFISTPLILGFAIYFAFWHSTHALEEQFLFIKNNNNKYSYLKYLKDLAPFSIVAVTFILVIGIALFSGGQKDLSSYIIVLLALITLPHFLLFDRLQQEATSNSN